MSMPIPSFRLPRSPHVVACCVVAWCCMIVSIAPASAQTPAPGTRPPASGPRPPAPGTTQPAPAARRAAPDDGPKPAPTPAAKPAGREATARDDDPTDDDFERKAALLQSSRWRRAVFELGEWLSGQEIYTPQQVVRMKSDFNRRVAAMTAAELEDLLDDLELKFKVMETPEAKDARAWVGQYLSAMSDHRRQQALRDVPDVVAMSAGQLATEIRRIEQQRDAIRQRQESFDQTRQAQVAGAQANLQATSKAIAAGEAQAASTGAYSPYRRPNNNGKLPFSDVNPYAGGLGIGIGIGGFGGAFFNLGTF